MGAPRIRVVARFAWPFPQVSPFMAGSVVAHGVAVSLVLLLPIVLGSRRQRIEPPLVVDLVAPKLARPAAASAPAPAPEVVTPSPPKPEPPPPASVVPKPPKEKPERKPQPKPQPKAAPPPPPATPPATGKAAAGATVAGQGPATTPGSGSITALESEDFEFAWYRDSVTAALYGHWVKPILDGVDATQEVSVTFEILRDGSFRDLRIDVSSGIPSLDRSALRAVADAAPFPPLPPAWVKPQLSARFRFSLDPE